MPVGIGLLFYRLGLKLYLLALKLVAFFGHEKAKLWLKGRVKWKGNLKPIQASKAEKIWIHCASLGEYEMAIPLMQKIKSKQSDIEIVLSFFSPSGYEYCTSAPHFDYKIYLPIDNKSNATYLVKAIKPKAAIFVKYELWYFYLMELKQKRIPTYLVNAQFNENSIFFQWYGNLHRLMLNTFTKVFVVDVASKDLAKKVMTNSKIEVSGDSRLERVLALANENYELEGIEDFRENTKVLIVGSSYEKEEQIAFEFFTHNADWKLIITPHEASKQRIESIANHFKSNEVLYFSHWGNYNVEEKQAAKVLIVDGIGHLSRLYRFADVAIVGGGFKGALHNAYEALVYQIPVFYGADFGTSGNWQQLFDEGLAFELSTVEDFNSNLERVISSVQEYQKKHKDFWKKSSSAQDLLAELL